MCASVVSQAEKHWSFWPFLLFHSRKIIRGESFNLNFDWIHPTSKDLYDRCGSLWWQNNIFIVSSMFFNKLTFAGKKIFVEIICFILWQWKHFLNQTNRKRTTMIDFNLTKFQLRKYVYIVSFGFTRIEFKVEKKK